MMDSFSSMRFHQLAVAFSLETGEYSTPLFSSPWLYVAVFFLITLGYGSFLLRKKHPVLRYNVVIAGVLVVCLMGAAFIANKQFQ